MKRILRNEFIVGIGICLQLYFLFPGTTYAEGKSGYLALPGQDHSTSRSDSFVLDKSGVYRKGDCNVRTQKTGRFLISIGNKTAHYQYYVRYSEPGKKTVWCNMKPHKWIVNPEQGTVHIELKARDNVLYIQDMKSVEGSIEIRSRLANSDESKGYKNYRLSGSFYLPSQWQGAEYIQRYTDNTTSNGTMPEQWTKEIKEQFAGRQKGFDTFSVISKQSGYGMTVMAKEGGRIKVEFNPKRAYYRVVIQKSVKKNETVQTITPHFPKTPISIKHEIQDNWEQAISDIDLRGHNKIKNPGFEFDSTFWTAYSRNFQRHDISATATGDAAEMPYFTDEESFEGKKSLCIPYNNIAVAPALQSFGIPVIPGKKYTCSLYMKTNKAGQDKGIGYKLGISDMVPNAGATVKTVKLTENWKRYSVTFTPKRYFVVLGITRQPSYKATPWTQKERLNGVKVWIDACQLEEGPLTPFTQPDFEVGMQTRKTANLYIGDKALEFGLLLKNNTSQKKTVTLKWAAKDFSFSELEQGSIDLEIKANTMEKVPVLLKTEAYGTIIVRTELYNDSKKCVGREKFRLTRYREAMTKSFKNRKLFGIHNLPLGFMPWKKSVNVMAETGVGSLKLTMDPPSTNIMAKAAKKYPLDRKPYIQGRGNLC